MNWYTNLSGLNESLLSACSVQVYRCAVHSPALSEALRSRDSLAPGVPRPSDRDFRRSLLHHFQSGCALKWASFT